MTAVLVATPNPVTAAGDPFDLDGTGFEVRQTRIVFNGVTGATFRPASDGTFTQSFVASSATTQSIRAEQCVAGTWTTVANLTVTIGAVYTPPSGGLFTDLPNWTLTFEDNFDREVPRGHFLDGSPDGFRTADGRYFAFKPTWQDTSKHGYYGTSANIEITGGVMDILCNVVGGYGRTATITARPAGSTAQGGQIGTRTYLKMKCTSTGPGFKYVPLGWADAATGNDMLTYGEMDWPEGNLEDSPHGFLHFRNGANPSDQYAAIPSPDTVDMTSYHEFVKEWIPSNSSGSGGSYKTFLDGTQIGTTQTSRIPNAAFHENLQFETSTGGDPAPSSGTTAHIYIERFAIWRYHP